MPLYHAEIGFPKMDFPQGVFPLTYSNHAIIASKNDRYGKVNLPIHITARNENLVEIETQGSAIVKLVYRIAYSAEYDLILAISVVGGQWHVKTVWLNSVNDCHRTLKRSAYAIPYWN